MPFDMGRYLLEVNDVIVTLSHSDLAKRRSWSCRRAFLYCRQLKQDAEGGGGGGRAVCRWARSCSEAS